MSKKSRKDQEIFNNLLNRADEAREYAHEVLIVSDKDQENYCVIYRVTNIPDTVYTKETGHIKRNGEKLYNAYFEIKNHLYIGFCKKKKYKSRARTQGTHIQYLTNSNYDNRLLFSIYEGYLMCKEPYSNVSDESCIFSDKKGNYCLFEGRFIDSWNRTVAIPQYNNDIPEYKYKEREGYNLLDRVRQITDEPVFSVVRYDYDTEIIKKNTIFKNYEEMHFIGGEDIENKRIVKHQKLINKYRRKENLWNLYASLESLVNAWIEGTLEGCDIDRICTANFFKEGSLRNNEDRYADYYRLGIYEYECMIYKENDFRVLKCRNQNLIALFEDKQGFEDTRELWTNDCFLTNKELGEWVKRRVNNEPTEEIEENMKFYIFMDRLRIEMVCYLTKHRVDLKDYKRIFEIFPVQDKPNVYKDGSYRIDQGRLTPIPSWLIKRKREKGYLLDCPEDILKDFLKRYGRDKLLIKGFAGIDELNFQYSPEYQIESMNYSYIQKNDTP